MAVTGFTPETKALGLTFLVLIYDPYYDITVMVCTDISSTGTKDKQ